MGKGISDARIGAMILNLQSRRSGTHYYSPRYQPQKRTYTDEEIMAAFGLTPAQMEKCIEARRRASPRIWNSERVRAAYFDFVDKNKRWPTPTDHKNWRESGLPDRSSLQLWAGDVQGEYARKNWRKLTPEMVFTISNITIRREVTEKIGIEKLLRKGAGEIIQQDDFGTLWKIPFPDGRDSHAIYVEVTNSTPKVDKNGKVVTRNGEPVYDHYFLRVPPNTRTARAAVAWTFDKPAAEFVGFAAQS